MFVDVFQGAFSMLLEPEVWLWIAGGFLYGVFAGAMPGIGTTLAFALLLPLTLTMEPVDVVVLLLSMTTATAFSNSLPAIVLNIPGNPAAVMTAIDGNILYKQGKGDIALGASYLAAAGGQILSIPMFVVLIVPLSGLAYVFQAPELFGVYLIGIVTLISIASDSVLKGLLSAAVGLLVGLVGLDPLTTEPRFTLGLDELRPGFNTVAVVVGLLAVGEIFRALRQSFDWSVPGAERKKVRLPRLSALGGRDFFPAMFGGTIIGTLVGAIPGAGAAPAAVVSYQQAKLASKHPEEFGRGSITGIIANEAAQNASNSGELIPTLALGIPGSGSMLILLSILVTNGLTPGPFLMENNPELLQAGVAGLVGGSILIVVFGMVLAGWTLMITRVDRQVVMVGALGLVVVGGIALRGSIVDVFALLLFGVIGYLMYRYGYSPAAAALAVILAKDFEASLRYGLALSNDSFWELATRPVTGSLIVVAIVLLVGGFWRERRSRLRMKEAEVID